MKKAVLFMIFNRPETTRTVFEAIRNYQPEQLYIAADGPRPNVTGEDKRCNAARAVVDGVDWPCEVHKLFRERNLGCREAVSLAVSWFFDCQAEGIIIEDDCLPSPDFFRFAALMLDRYRDDDRVMHIGGANFQAGIRRGDGDWYFSHIAHIWGWASWRRAWRHYDVDMKIFDAYKKSGRVAELFPGNRFAQWRMLEIFELTRMGSPNFNTWDCQWHFALAARGAAAVIPNANLVSNIGGVSTHAVDERACHLEFAPFPTEAEAPTAFGFDTEADEHTFDLIYRGGVREKLRYFLARAGINPAVLEKLRRIIRKIR